MISFCFLARKIIWPLNLSLECWLPVSWTSSIRKRGSRYLLS